MMSLGRTEDNVMSHVVCALVRIVQVCYTPLARLPQ